MGDKPNGAVPTQVQIVDSGDPEHGADTYVNRLYWYGNKRCPKIEIGHENLYGDLKAIEDPWVILHELAHVWTVEDPEWHAPPFCYAYHELVTQYLGESSGEALKSAMRAEKIRLVYSLI